MKWYIRLFFLWLCFYLPFSTVLAGDFRIHLKRVFFSPNYDGHQDTIFLELPEELLEQNSLVADWKLNIYSESSLLIYNFSADLRRKKQKGFMSYFFANRKPGDPVFVPLPSFLEWNGTALNGIIPPDGRYIARMSITRIDGSVIHSFDKYFYLDSHRPRAVFSYQTMFLSPDGDGISDILSIRQKVVGEASDRWRGSFYDPSGKEIRTFLWTTKQVPKILQWDGKDDRGILQDEGFFRYRLQGQDFSGNQIQQDLDDITLRRDRVNLDIHANINHFSPNGDHYKDRIQLIAQIPPNIQPATWKVIIYEVDDEEIVYKTFAGKAIPPPFLLWDGISDEDEEVDDGEFFYRIEVQLTEESTPIQSRARKLSINRDKMNIRFHINTNHFTPDNDKEKDSLEILPELENFRTHVWTIHLLEKYYRKDGRELLKTIKKWRGRGMPPRRILWNGLGDDGVKIGSLSDLEMYFYFANELKERKYFKVKNFQSGVLVNRRAEALVISIPSYKFRTRENDTISKILATLNDYPDYKVELQVHSRQPGDDIRNQERCERKARELFAKFFGKKEPFGNFDYRGYGEVAPVFYDDTLYHQEKNERVDFVLTLAKK